MKRSYENIELEIVFFNNDDIVTTSPDNVTGFPDFPENLPENFGS